MPSADQPTRRNHTSFNNKRFVGWCAGSSFWELSVVVGFSNGPRTQSDLTKRDWKYHMIDGQENYQKTTTDEQQLDFDTRHINRRDETQLMPTSKKRQKPSTHTGRGEDANLMYMYLSMRRVDVCSLGQVPCFIKNLTTKA